MSVHHEVAHTSHGSAFGADRFGQFAETTARFFGTPQYLIGQTVAVVVWIALNSVAFLEPWDPKPWIMLNLIFSTQAAYAAPLILLAQTRQAARDKAYADAQALHREDVARAQAEMLAQNTALTEAVHQLSVEIRQLVAEQRGTP